MSKLPKRCLPAGRFLLTDLDTGEQQLVVRYGLIEARERRERFIRKNKKLAAKAFAFGHCHSSYKTHHGRELVERARKRLGYSPTTGTGDIYVGLWASFKDLGFAKSMAKGCSCYWCRTMNLGRL